MQKSQKKSGFRSDHWHSLGFIWLVLIPILIQYTVTSAVPMVMSFVLTFTDWSLIGTKNFIGLTNWKRLLSDAEVWNSLKVTSLYALYVVIPVIILGLVLALIINQKKKFVGFFKATYFFPVITSTIVISSIWKWLFIAKETGVVNQLIGFFGIPPQFFFGKSLALLTVALLGIFQSAGISMVYFYAGLKAIPLELIEAARVDGCTGSQSFFRIKLPLLKPTLTYVLIVLTSGALKVYDSIYMLFNQTGGPENVANSLVMHTWRTSFMMMQMGYGSTIAFVLFFLIMIISIIQFTSTSKDNTK